jgi:prophage maintenance system killer protein
MAIRYLTIDEVITLHDHAVERFGGSLGLTDRGKLEAPIAAPMQNVFGTENSLRDKDGIAEWPKAHTIPLPLSV